VLGALTASLRQAPIFKDRHPERVLSDLLMPFLPICIEQAPLLRGIQKGRSNNLGPLLRQKVLGGGHDLPLHSPDALLQWQWPGQVHVDCDGMMRSSRKRPPPQHLIDRFPGHVLPGILPILWPRWDSAPSLSRRRSGRISQPQWSLCRARLCGPPCPSARPC
jgi:hypothetical protein